jgi:hypothetical protein
LAKRFAAKSAIGEHADHAFNAERLKSLGIERSADLEANRGADSRLDRGMNGAGIDDRQQRATPVCSAEARL